MNSDNNTIVSGELMKKLREAGLDKDYAVVPAELEKRAKELLDGRDVVDIDEPTKREFNEKREHYLAQKAAVKEGNRRHEEQMKKPFIQDLLTGK